MYSEFFLANTIYHYVCFYFLGTQKRLFVCDWISLLVFFFKKICAKLRTKSLLRPFHSNFDIVCGGLELLTLGKIGIAAINVQSPRFASFLHVFRHFFYGSPHLSFLRLTGLTLPKIRDRSKFMGIRGRPIWYGATNYFQVANIRGRTVFSPQSIRGDKLFSSG